MQTDWWTCCSVVIGLCKADLMTACNYRTIRDKPARVTVTWPASHVPAGPEHIRLSSKSLSCIGKRCILQCARPKEVVSEDRSHTAKGFRLRPEEEATWPDQTDTLRYPVIAAVLLCAYHASQATCLLQYTAILRRPLLLQPRGLKQF